MLASGAPAGGRSRLPAGFRPSSNHREIYIDHRRDRERDASRRGVLLYRTVGAWWLLLSPLRVLFVYFDIRPLLLNSYRTRLIFNFYGVYGFRLELFELVSAFTVSGLAAPALIPVPAHGLKAKRASRRARVGACPAGDAGVQLLSLDTLHGLGGIGFFGSWTFRRNYYWKLLKFYFLVPPDSSTWRARGPRWRSRGSPCRRA